MLRNKLLSLTMLMLAIIIMLALGGCHADNDVGTTSVGRAYDVGSSSIGRGYYVSIGDNEYVYLDDVRNAYDSTALLHYSLNAIDDTPDELLMDADAYKIYRARGANGYEALVRVNNGNEIRELLRVVLENFDSITEMMSFFGISAADDIVSCNFSSLVITTARNDLFYSHYESYFTSESKEIKEAVFDILSSMIGNADVATSHSLRGREGAEPGDDMQAYSEWAKGVRKIDITLSSGVVLPIAFSLSDGYIQVLDSGGSFAFITALTAEIQKLIESVI